MTSRVATRRKANNRKGYTGSRSGPSNYPKGLKDSCKKPHKTKGSRGIVDSSLPNHPAPNAYTAPRRF